MMPRSKRSPILHSNEESLFIHNDNTLSDNLFAIKKLYHGKMSTVSDAIPENFTHKFLKGSIFLSEIVLSWLGNSVGLATILHSPFGVDEVAADILSGLTSTLDSIVHYALLFNIYKAGAGLSSTISLKNKKDEQRNQLCMLNAIFDKLSKEEISDDDVELFAALQTYYYAVMSYKKDASARSHKKRMLVWGLLLAFLFMRFGGAYFTMANFYGAVGTPSEIDTPIGVGSAISSILLYFYTGTLTRHNAIDNYIDPLPIQDFEKLEVNFKKLQQKYGVTEDKAHSNFAPAANLPMDLAALSHTIETLYKNTSQRQEPSTKHSYFRKSYLIAGILFLGEIVLAVGFNDFIGVHSLLVRGLPTLIASLGGNFSFPGGGWNYALAIGCSFIDAAVQFALMRSVFSGVAFGPSQENPQKTAIKALLDLDEIFSRLLTMENKKREPFLSDEEWEILQKNYLSFKNRINLNTLSPKINRLRTILKCSLLTVFAAMRFSGNYFSLCNFFILIHAAAFAATPIGLGVILGLALFCTAISLLTRHKTMSDLFCPGSQQNFFNVDGKFKELKLVRELNKVLQLYDTSINHPRSPNQPVIPLTKGGVYIDKIDKILLNFIQRQETLEEKNLAFEIIKKRGLLNKSQSISIGKHKFFTHQVIDKTRTDIIKQGMHNELMKEAKNMSQHTKCQFLHKARKFTLFKEIDAEVVILNSSSMRIRDDMPLTKTR